MQSDSIRVRRELTSGELWMQTVAKGAQHAGWGLVIFGVGYAMVANARPFLWFGVIGAILIISYLLIDSELVRRAELRRRGQR